MAKKRKLPKKKKKSVAHILRYSSLCIISMLCLLSIVSFHEGDSTKNWLGLLGHVIGFAYRYMFGLAATVVPIFGIWFGVMRMKSKESLALRIVYFCFFLFSSCLLLAMLSTHHPRVASMFRHWVYANYYPKSAYFDPVLLRHYLGGVPLHHIYCDGHINVQRVLGSVGSFLIFATLFLASGLLLFDISLKKLWEKNKSLAKRMMAIRPPRLAVAKPQRSVPFESVEEKTPTVVREDPLKKERKIKFAEPKKVESISPKVSTTDYQLPEADLLTQIEHVDQTALKNDLRRQADILEETLLSFGIEAKVGDIHCGPTITSFEVHPAVGVKVQKIKSLENDIALNLQAKSIRIIAPIPGKAAVGIEVPNPHPQEVSYYELLQSYQAKPKKATIPLLLGKKVNGEDVIGDLTRMPHMIIAGATGSGKSVCINTMVMSIVMNAHPDEIKLVMVDPKKVELTAYTHLPHMLAPVITEPGGACSALNWLVGEMERRYEIFRLLGIRNITSFNTRKRDKNLEESLEMDIPEKLPYIVLIIDELADLMMVSSSDIETPIARIAQMARAVGIHAILATQRPSREVITGLIKANFPCRIAFKVASRVNSQIIMDENGAESLLGNGDMLFMPPGTSSLIRAQGAFIRDEDINKVIGAVCAQAPTNYLIPSFDNYREANLLGTTSEGNDPLYEQAKALVFETGNASTTFLQRKLKVGYARAASLMDELEGNGIIGPSEGAKPRKIFYPSDS